MRKIQLFIGVLIIIALSGCSGGGYGPLDPSDESAQGAGEDGSGGGWSNVEDGVVPINQISEQEMLAQRTLYFSYDSSVLPTNWKKVAEAHARYMVRTNDVRVVLSGHTDERGTREYNLSLAQARATSVAKVLQALGVSAQRIQTVSFGEERPAKPGHNESAWRFNRRVEIGYQ